MINHPILGSCRTYLHRLRAVEALGQRLRKGEDVHHISEDKSDNRWPENLEVKTKSEHSRHHSTGRIFSPEWKRNISQAKKGRSIKGHPGYRGHRSDEFKRKVSAGMKKFLATLSPAERRQRMAIAHAKPFAGPRTTRCRRGHDIGAVGRDRWGACNQCRKER